MASRARKPVWWRVTVLCCAELMALSMWYAPAAAAPALTAHWHLPANATATLTIGIQFGFVIGTLLFALLNIEDLVRPQRLFTVCALVGAAINALPAWCELSAFGLLATRVGVGITMAGIYPPALKLIATWCGPRKGLGLGALIGALTIGTASPHLLRLVVGAQWREILLVSSALTLFASMMVVCFLDRHEESVNRATRFDRGRASRAIAKPGVRLPIWGYLGHMWELYAMWTWTPRFLADVFPSSESLVAVIAFCVISAGAIGSVVAGVLAYRMRRTSIAIGAM